MRERLRALFQSQKGQKISACGRHLYYCELKERLRVPFQSKKGQKFSACGRHLYYCVQKERLRALFQSNKGQKVLPAAGTYIMVNWQREAEGAFSKSQEKSWPKLHKCLFSKRCLLNYGVEGGIPPLSLKSDTLPPHGPKAHPLLEAGRLVYCG